jgi:hypothetical protein
MIWNMALDHHEEIELEDFIKAISGGTTTTPVQTIGEKRHV